MMAACRLTALPAQFARGTPKTFASRRANVTSQVLAFLPSFRSAHAVWLSFKGSRVAVTRHSSVQRRRETSKARFLARAECSLHAHMIKI